MADAKGRGSHVVTEHSYDAQGRRTKTLAPDPSAGASGAGTVATRFVYDGAGRLCRVVENSTQSDATFGGLADPCSTAIAGTATTNVSTHYGYDEAGNLITMVDANGNATGYTYDAAGQMTSRTDPLGKTVRWRYDEAGNRTAQINRIAPPMIDSVTWTYDAAGRVSSRTADGVTTAYTYDANGNRLTASDGTLTITSTYDRLNRVLIVDDEDAGSAADTTYGYDFTSPTWTDPTGTYLVSIDKFDRPTKVDDPVNGADFTWTYGADGQPSAFGQPNGNTTAVTYDPLGRATSKVTTGTGATSRASYTWTHNRAGQVLSEASTITNDPSNGTIGFTYDALGRLTGYDRGGTTTSYGWDNVPNRTSVKVGTNPAVTTSFDAANRPSSPGYSSDDDGRLMARPDLGGQTFEWDNVGRLTKVKNAAGTITLATYSYDSLDRLRLVDRGPTDQTRFRYVGLTTWVAQVIDHDAGVVTRHVGTGWTGERLLDWTGSGSNLRVYGTNGHHDTTWEAGSSGTVSTALRYDPWGTPLSTVPSGYPEFRFQGSWFDPTTELSWVVTRWYAAAQGRFISEDSLLGEPGRPASRHLYAYGEGDPVANWDPDGRASSRSISWGLQNPRGTRGRFFLSLFIRPTQVPFPLPFGWLKGDGRGYSTSDDLTCTRSRACVNVDFSNRRVKVVIASSCGAWLLDPYKCTDAYAINKASNQNTVTFSESSAGVINIRWNLFQSRFPQPTTHALNGSIRLSPAGTATPGIKITGDGFPRSEAFYTNGGARIAYALLGGDNPDHLLAWYGDWSRSYKWPSLSGNYV